MVVIFLYYQLLIHKRNFRLVHEWPKQKIY